jgi:hypothetical protein
MSALNQGFWSVKPDMIYMQANSLKNANPHGLGLVHSRISICQQSLMLVLSWVLALGK